MHRLFALLAALALVLSLGVSATLAIAPSQEACEADGGTFDRTQGTTTCIKAESEPVGNSASGGPQQTVDTTEEETSKGTFNNKAKDEESTECSGPGNSTAQCPSEGSER